MMTTKFIIVFIFNESRICTRQKKMQYSTELRITEQYSAPHHSTVQYSTVQYSTVQYSTVQYSTVEMKIIYKVVCIFSFPSTAMKVCFDAVQFSHVPYCNVPSPISSASMPLSPLTCSEDSHSTPFV